MLALKGLMRLGNLHPGKSAHRANASTLAVRPLNGLRKASARLRQLACAVFCALGFAALPSRAAGTVVAWGSNFYGEGKVPAGLTDVGAVAAGTLHSLALRADGRVVGWGDNETFHQVVPPAKLTNAIAVAAGWFHSLALKADGTVVAWGADYAGQVTVPAELRGVVAIAAGSYHSVALQADGTVVVWGAYTNVPASATNVTAIAANEGQTFTLRDDGQIVVWDASLNSNPAAVFLPEARHVVAITAGHSHGLALLGDGTVTGWGGNNMGPLQVPPGLTDVVAIAAGRLQDLALRADGTVVGWGRNDFGEATPPAGLSNVLAIAAGGYHSLALVGEGAPVILGTPGRWRAYSGSTVAMNARGIGTPPLSYQWQLDGNDLADARGLTLILTNVQVRHTGAYSVRVGNALGEARATNTFLTVSDSAPLILNQPVDATAFPGESVLLEVKTDGSLPREFQWLFNGVEIDGATNSTLSLADLGARQVGQYAVRVRNRFGTVDSAPAKLVLRPFFAWGYNGHGQRDVPVDLTNAVAVAAGVYHSLALRSDGTVAAWGDNEHGQANVPPDLGDMVALSAGWVHSLALKRDGTVVAWGTDNSGVLQVPSGLAHVVAIAAATEHNLALRTDGTVVAWGARTNVPPAVTNVVEIAAGGSQSLALRADGRVISWDASATAWPDLRHVVAIAAGRFHNLALLGDGTVTGWGWDSSGELRPPPDLTNAVAIAAGEQHSVALRADGTIVSWGNLHAPTLTNVLAIAAGSGHGLALVGETAPIFLGAQAEWTAYSGTSVALNARGLATPPARYQWHFNGAELPGATGLCFVLTNVQEHNSGTYSVRLSNALGVAVATNAVLTVIDSPPILLREPSSQQSYPGGTVSFVVAAEGSEPLEYQWLYEGSELPGMTNEVLTLSNLQLNQAGTYSALVRNAFGQALTTNATLRLDPVIVWGDYYDLPNAPWEHAYVPEDLADVVALAGGSYHSLALKADGTVATWGIDWRGDGVTALPAGLSNVVAIAAGAYHSLALRHDGTIVSWGEMDQTSVPANLKDLVAIAASRTHSLALKVDGTVQTLISGGTSDIFTGLRDVVAIAAGDFHILALRGDGTVAAWGVPVLTNVPPDLKDAVGIAVAQTSSFALKSDGTVLRWHWRTGSELLPAWTNVVAISAGGNHCLGLRSDGTVAAWGNSRGAIVPVGLTNVVAIAAGRNHSFALVGREKLVPMRDLSMARLLWRSDGAAPWFGQTNVTSDSVEAVQSGAITHMEQSRLRTTVFGPGTLSFWWKVSSEHGHDFLRFSVSGREVANLSGEVDWQYGALDLPPGLHTVEWVYAKDAAGSSGQDTAWLARVRFVPQGTLAPRILIQPMAQTVFRGTSAMLNVEALGAEPLSFQWRLNGIDLPGATNELLTINAPQPADAGEYAVEVGNAYGWTISSNALLHVQDAPPRILVQPISQVVTPGQTAVFQVAAEGTMPQSYQWRLGGDDLSGATNATLVLPGVKYRQAGAYSVRVSNAIGSATSAKAVLSVISVRAWGSNERGQLSFPLYLTNAIAVDGGDDFSLVLRSNGTLTGAASGNSPAFAMPRSVPGFVAVAAGASHGLALRSEGTVLGWGLNDHGQTLVPFGLTNVVAIAAGHDFSLAQRADGTVVVWRSNAYGQTNVPVGLTNAVAIAAGFSHCLALRADGTVVGWGQGIAADVPSGLRDVVAIASGAYHNLALRNDGTVAAWGENGSGQLNVPADLTNAVAVAAGGWHSLALRADGTVLGWGDSARGQTNVPTDLVQVVAIAAGYHHSLALVGEGDPPPPRVPIARALSFPSLRDNRWSVSLRSDIGKIYSLESKDSLTSPDWTALPMIVGDGQLKALLDPSDSVPQRFYRVRQFQ